jgi:hypothetical protein
MNMPGFTAEMSKGMSARVLLSGILHRDAVMRGCGPFLPGKRADFAAGNRDTWNRELR